MKFFMVAMMVLGTSSTLFSQKSAYSGTFMTPDGAVTLQLKEMPSEWHGVLASTEGLFALKAESSDRGINGTIFTNVGNYNFTGAPIQGGLSIVFQGMTYTYYQTSTEHELAQVDLTPYFTDGQGSAPQATEPARSKTPNSNGVGDEKELFNYIAGGQLVYYQRTSILNDSNASSITYINFCADGRFNLNYDGGFSVEGDYGGNAHGASRGSNYGTWHLENRQGSVVGILNFANGTQSVQAINRNYLLQGRWRIGNTQYAFVRNKAVCR